MSTKQDPPIATVSFLRRWQRQHRRLTGSTPRRRHVFMARTLALTGMTPEQCSVVTAHLARVEATYCCDAVAEHVAAMLRPALFATALECAPVTKRSVRPPTRAEVKRVAARLLSKSSTEV